MKDTPILEHDKIDEENPKNELTPHEFYKALNQAIEQYENEGVILLETPAENYIHTNIDSMKSMLKNGFEGIYISFQRPFSNLSSFFKQQGVDPNKLFIIDCATAFAGEKPYDNTRCISMSQDFEADEMVKTILSTLSKLDGKNKFVFVDSLTTLAIHQSIFETSRFTDLLIDSIKDSYSESISFVFNVAKDLKQKVFIDNLMRYVDESIRLKA